MFETQEMFEKQDMENDICVSTSYAFRNGCVAYYVTVCLFLADNYMAKMFPVDFAGGITSGMLMHVFGNA